MTPTITEWDAMDELGCHRLANALASAHGFTFVRLELEVCGQVRREVARYERAGHTWCFVPGGEVTLGFDMERLSPDTRELEEWQEFAEEYEVGMDLHAWVESVTLRPRVVTVPGVMVERVAWEIGWERMEPGVNGAPWPGGHSLQFSGGQQFGTTPDRVERAVTVRHADVAGRLASEGCRLLASDEWEHACSGGARSLFRWGEHAPMDSLPLGPGALQTHREPNAFGLFIASNPYHYETVREPELLRGGDGGSAMCGGNGPLLAWLPLASAGVAERRDPLAPLLSGYTIARRAFQVG